MSDFLFFAVFPYITIIVFLIGTIFRYQHSGYKFSSLSSEFLEARTLYWGSMPFHLGVLFLFVGHLTAFLFPKAVLAWNGQPMRLIILEGTAFIFGIAVFIGLILLLRRRITKPKIRVVTTTMDILVLFFLLVQTFSGLWIAYSYRWGSSWFAAVLTPYIRSIFVLNPDIEAVSNMPFMVKTHIISAISIILIVPFSRLVHFLVPPFSYMWRSYQQVIWYWDRKQIRNSGQFQERSITDKK